MSIELLLVVQRLEVGLDRERNNGGRAVGEVLLKRFCFYGCTHDVDI